MSGLDDLFEGVEEVEAEDFSLEAEEIEFSLLPQMIFRQAVKRIEQARSVLKAFEFKEPAGEYKGGVLEVVFGATRKDGGTRGKAITIGGERSLPYYMFEARPAHRPVIAHDVFDVPFRLPSSVKKQFGDAIKTPVTWAKKQVEEFGAEAITLHLVSTDPLWGDRPAEKAAKTVQDVLAAVDVPLIVSGSGNYEKDVKVLTKAAEAAHGERVLLSSVSPDMKDYRKVVEAAKKHGHLVLSLVSMDVPGMKQMNKNIIKEGLPREHIIMDPNTASLGYGIDYSITTMERIRLNALKGDAELQMPILAGVSNAWSAREAWMKDESLGPRELRGPLWETVTATVALLSGADVFMMLHPAAIKTLKSIVDALFDDKKVAGARYEDWVSMD